jgi:hypothetical protein
MSFTVKSTALTIDYKTRPEQDSNTVFTKSIISIINYNIITMAQQPYIGSGLLLPPLSEVTKSCAFVAVGDWPTGRATVLSM